MSKSKLNIKKCTAVLRSEDEKLPEAIKQAAKLIFEARDNLQRTEEEHVKLIAKLLCFDNSEVVEMVYYDSDAAFCDTEKELFETLTRLIAWEVWEVRRMQAEQEQAALS